MMEKAVTFQLEANGENKDVIFSYPSSQPQEFYPCSPWISGQNPCFWEKVLMAATTEPQ